MRWKRWFEGWGRWLDNAAYVALVWILHSTASVVTWYMDKKEARRAGSD